MRVPYSHALLTSLCLSLLWSAGCASKSGSPDASAGSIANGGSETLTHGAGNGGGAGAGTAGALASTNGGAGGNGGSAEAGAAAVAGTSSDAGAAAIAGANSGAGAGGGPGPGGSAGTGGRPSTGGDPFLADVTPSKSGELWRLSFGNVVFEVNATKGGSVTTYSLSGHNILVDGSHFRPSPQKTWTWPPPVEIAQSAYAGSLSGQVIVMDSQTSAQWGLKAKKRFWANAANQVVTIEYTLTNTSNARASWAPWEVSRINATGLTFFPEGTGIAAKPASYGQLLRVQLMAGVSWLDYKPALYTTGSYIVAHDGLEGWSAHAEAGVVFIKSFPDILPAQIPPAEGEIQLWTDNTHSALEMENEGAYVALDAGQSIVWTLRWYLRAIPSDTPAVAGSAKLVDFVRAQLLK